jgi:hypothetical protein
MGPVKQYTDEPVDAPVDITVYPGADGGFTLYEDDGKTFAHKAGDFMRVVMNWNDATRRLTLALAPGSRLRPPLPRLFTVRLVGGASSARVVFEGKPVDIVL